MSVNVCIHYDLKVHYVLNKVKCAHEGNVACGLSKEELCSFGGAAAGVYSYL